MAAKDVSTLYGEREELPDIRLLHKYFESEVKENEERSKKNGVYFKGEFTSYHDVNRKASSMARNLLRTLSNNIDVEQKCCVIGVDVLPSPDLLVAFLAILKCGATYLPLDTLLPLNRIKHIVAEAKPVLILVDDKSTHKLHNNKDVCNDTAVMGVRELINESGTSAEEAPPKRLDDAGGDALAAVIYTSGSTGVPKGVLIRHISVLNRLQWQWKTYPWQNDEVGCFKTAILFVDHMVEVFSTMLKLVPMVIAEKGLATHVDKFLDLLEKFKVTRLVFVPSLLRNIISFASLSVKPRLPDLKLFISNSETLTPRLLTDFFNTFEGKRFANLYGSTETMADVTWETYDNQQDIKMKSHDGKLSIGRPLLNTNIYVVDQNISVLPLGEVGEICVSGLNLAAGYMDSSRSAAFIANPHSNKPDHMFLYRTGDYGKLDEGKIIYHGRQDMQVKIRGHRVDTSEIERIVGNVPDVEAVTILCHSLSETSVVVVAYYTVKSGKSVTDDDIIDACKKALPSYMLPKPLKIEQMPLQSHTGKVDRQALKKIFEDNRIKESERSGELEGLDETSASVISVIARVLNLPKTSISLNRSFFEIGGNSVNGIETIVKLREQGLHITIDEFAQASSIRELIETCELECAKTQLSGQDEYEVIPLKEAENHADVVDMFARCFFEKEALTTFSNLALEDFISFAESAHDSFMRWPSIVVRRKLDKKIVAGDILCDFTAGEDQTLHSSPAMGSTIAFLGTVEDPLREKLIEEGAGPIMLNVALFVDVSLPGTEQMKLVYILEENVIEVAKKEGFKGVIATNTSTVTQNVCEHHFGYQLLTEMNPKNFDYNGTKPFSSAPEDYSLKVQIKYV